LQRGGGGGGVDGSPDLDGRAFVISNKETELEKFCDERSEEWGEERSDEWEIVSYVG
jgi:hypothetical protein